MIQFKERLRMLRLQKKLSQSQFAEILNVKQNTVSSWETGFRQPDFEMLEKIADYFGVSADYLLGRKEE